MAKVNNSETLFLLNNHKYRYTDGVIVDAKIKLLYDLIMPSFYKVIKAYIGLEQKTRRFGSYRVTYQLNATLNGRQSSILEFFNTDSKKSYMLIVDKVDKTKVGIFTIKYPYKILATTMMDMSIEYDLDTKSLNSKAENKRKGTTVMSDVKFLSTKREMEELREIGSRLNNYIKSQSDQKAS